MNKSASLNNKRSVSRLLLLICIAFILGEMLFPGMIRARDALVRTLLLGLLLNGLVIFLPAALFIQRRGGAAAFGLSWRQQDGKVLLWSFLLGGAAFLLATGLNTALYPLWDRLGLTLNTVLESVTLQSLPRLLLAILALSIIPAITEETLFRGAFFFSWLQQDRFRALYHSAILFSLFHLNPTNLPSFLLLGLLLGAMAMTSGSCIAAIAFHAAHNLAAVFLVFFTEGHAQEAEQVLVASQYVIAGIAYMLPGALLCRIFYRRFRRAVAQQEARGRLLHPYKAQEQAYSVFLKESKDGAQAEGAAGEEITGGGTAAAGAATTGAATAGTATAGTATAGAAAAGAVETPPPWTAEGESGARGEKARGTGRVALAFCYALLIMMNVFVLFATRMAGGA